MTFAEDPFRGQPVIHGKAVRLEPLGPQHFDGILQMLNDSEGCG